MQREVIYFSYLYLFLHLKIILNYILINKGIFYLSKTLIESQMGKCMYIVLVFCFSFVLCKYRHCSGPIHRLMTLKLYKIFVITIEKVNFYDEEFG